MKKTLVIIVISLFSLGIYAQRTVGTLNLQPGVQDGYTLFNPASTTSSYLIDNCGRVVHSWQSDYNAANSVVLLENGNLLKACKVDNNTFGIAGKGGRIEILDWNSNIVWEYYFTDNTKVQHHDIEYLPNGNILILAVEYKSFAECHAAGMDTTRLGQGKLFPEFIAEVRPDGPTTGTVVWEWHMWDHLVQDINPEMDNYGLVGNHPELFDANYFIGSGRADWAHANSVFYNPDLDQIVISLNKFNEFIIIDHSTSPEESASHSGGNMGKGGDILYRYGNPVVYRHGTVSDQVNFGQHTVHWIPESYTDGGKIMFFNNGRGGRDFSSVDVVNPIAKIGGEYLIRTDTTFGPSLPDWSYTGNESFSFFSQNISGAQRLKNGNTLICEGANGHFFEIDSDNNIVWEYVNPLTNEKILSQGEPVIDGGSVFRATKYLPDYPAFIGRDLSPGDPLELNPDIGWCIVTSIDDRLEDIHLRVYPNPFTDLINIDYNSSIENTTLEVYDIMGKIICSEIISGSSIDLGYLPDGVYIMRIGTSYTKMIKK